MNFENDLKELIKKEYKSVRAFSKTADIPYSTIDNIFKRGIQGVSIQVVLKICNILNIDVEKIFDDKLILKHENMDDGILLYSLLDDSDRSEIMGEMKQMLKSDKYKSEIPNDILREIEEL